MNDANISTSPEGQKPCRTKRWDIMNRSLTTEEAADRIGVAAATLRDWKGQRIGPAYVQVTSRCVRYRESDVEKFISDRRVVPSPRQVGRFCHAPVHAAKKSVSVL
jgi:predicted DNA-binding transcriptional regulator AlpA